MDKDYYHSRLDKAKEQLMASRREDSSHRDSAQKKKKHKEDRRSHSRSRNEKKRRSRSRSDDRKHKKEHKHRDSKDKKERRDKDHKEHREHREDQYHRDRTERTERDRGDRIDRERAERAERYDRGERDERPDRGDRGERGGYDRRDRGGDRGGDRDRGGYRDYRRRQDRPVEEKDPYFQQRREIEKVRKTNPEKAEQLQAELQKRIILDRKEKEIEEAREKFKEAQKEMEQAKREDHTILVYCLPLKAKERDIWNFFSKTNCGKIRDIRIIRDARSGRSKGVAYVEFYTSDAVQKALTMSDQPFELKGRSFMGLRVQHSQAEKNRAAAAAKQMRVIKPADPIEQQQETIRRQTKVFVGGLVDKLSEMQETQLKDLFQPFGEIEYVDIHRDPQTGMCKGFAFIQYQDTEKARLAVKEMNGLEIRNQKISVQLINVAQKGEVSAHDEYLYSAGSKQSLMNKLSQSTGAPSYSNLQRPPISTVTTPYLIMTNMFKMEGTTPAFFDELKKEVQAQCDQFGVVERIFIERNNQGNIWIKYADTASALKAQESLNGKFFDGHKIFCYFVTENTYQTRVGI